MKTEDDIRDCFNKLKSQMKEIDWAICDLGDAQALCSHVDILEWVLEN